jgi:type IV pilus assembly protein PilY1
MIKRHIKPASLRTRSRQWWAAPTAFLATLLALPVNAGIAIPDDPLTTASRVAPNVLFILDDSGSMAFNYMPDDVPATSTPNVSMSAYPRNTLSYNPNTAYLPWMRADGTRMTAGVAYTAAYGSFNRAASGTINLGDSSSCRWYNYNNNYTTDEFAAGTGTQVCGGVQTFYVPRDTTQTAESYLGNGTNYYRYQIMAGGTSIQRGVYGAVARSNNLAVTVNGANPFNGSLGNDNVATAYTGIVLAGGGMDIVVSNTETGNNQRRFNYAVYSPAGNLICNGSLAKGASTTCETGTVVAGQYRVDLQRRDGLSTAYRLAATRYTTTSCDGAGSGSGWVGCTSTLPNSSRTLAQELANYATWFSYHRTRMKSAKAGASEAFSSLDSKVRVGFSTIWDSGRPGIRFDIPVNDGNDGRFVDSTGDVTTTSRSTWYSRLQNVIGYNGTPLLSALDNAGRYFSNTAQSGPYGPQSGVNQYSCRQNFSILTTDGYWNGDTTAAVGNADGTAGSTITGPGNQSFTYTPGAPYTDGYTNTLADVAMHYWKTDLRTESYMTNNVPPTAANPAFWQHMVTFGISIGLSGNKGWTSVAAVPQNATWNDPTDGPSGGDADRIDDLLHAAVNGRGTFVAASNPAEFTTGLGEALAAIAQRTSSYSNVASNSVSLDTGSQVFNASYVSGVWTGQLTARAVTTSGVSGTISWTSSLPAWGSRNVFTSTGIAGTTFPSTVQSALLTRLGGPANYPVSGADNASYIKGEARLEERNGGLLRNRTSILGDIIGSSPAYVKDTNTLYVGANDGMLHAFDARTGVELFAYVPRIVNMSNLSTVSRGDYTHKFFVDGPISVSSRSLITGRNVLVGTLGKGGKGVYALDVTAPAAATADSIHKWELAETPGLNMGLVLGKPILGRVQGGSAATVLGNGINSTNERAVLLVINADTGAVIREIDTGVGSAAAPNGLFAPTGVLGADGKTLAYVYAGDMQGNVWKFDLTSALPASWTVTRLFSARDGGGKAQPITGGIAVATHPTTNKRWVFFGTGRYLTQSDADSTNTDVQSMYGVMDDTAAYSRSNLTQRTVTVTSAELNGYPVRAFEAKGILPVSSKGWYIDLPMAGERIVQDAQVVSRFLITASMVPTGNACDADGMGFINALDAFTGTSAGGSYFDLDGDGRTDDTGLGGSGNLPVGSVNVGIGMPTLPNLLRGLIVVGGTGSGDLRSPRTSTPRWDRASWREIRRD